jgi:predicted enzyme related to lactoylglutathione lyase
MIHRPAEKEAKAKGTWIPYFSVENLDQTLEFVTAKKGHIEVPARSFPDRGKQAIIRDNQGALVGLMETSQGDPGDYLAEIGEWIWAQLSVREPEASLDFYEATIGFEEAAGNEEDANIYDHVWVSGGYFRASVGQIPEANTDANPNWIGFVRVSDVAATVEQATRLGGTVYLKPDPKIRDGNLAIILDPAGAAFVVLKYDPYTDAQP